MKKLLFFFILSMFILSSVSAVEYDLIFQKNTTANLVRVATTQGAPSSTLKCNITIQYPNSNILLSQGMTNNFPAPYQNVTFAIPNTLGVYQCTMNCKDGLFNGTESFYFKVTGNGKEEPQGSVIVFFSIAFLIIVGVMIYLIILSFGHLLNKDMTIMDVAYNFGIYFVLFGVFLLEQFYVGNPDIEGILNILLIGTGFTHILIPIIALFLSIVSYAMERKDIMLMMRRRGF